MGDIVNRWITEKLGLRVPPANDPPAFRFELASGILIAEILRKYGLLSDDEFVSLHHNNTRKSRHLNMNHLHQWMTNAGMDIQQILLVDVAEEKAGSAVKLLYELFLWLENGPRKKKIGDKAKYYLTTLKISPLSWENEQNKESPFPDYRGSVSSRRGSRKFGSGWDKLRMESPPETKAPKKQIIIRKPNWYTPLDKIHVPQLVLATGPFADLSEAAQAEALYFHREALNIIDRQYRLFHKVEDHLEEATKQHYLHNFQPRIRTDKEIQLDAQLKAKSEEYKNSIDEIQRFDKRLKANKQANKEKVKGSKYNLIYSNGKGSPDELEKSVEALKRRRQKINKTNEKLSKYRKETANRLIEEIPRVTEKELQETILKAVSRLPFSERMLADFIHNSHSEKTSFKQHACYEARQKQWANDFDLAKELQIAQQQEALKRSVLEHRTTQPSRRAEDEGTEELEEELLMEKMSMIGDILVNLVDVVVTVADYRSAMGNSAFGSDIFREAIESGDGTQAGVGLQNDKFVMELKQNSFQGENHVTLPAPPGPVIPLGKDDCKFLIHHVAIILDRFLQIATGSLIPMKAFTFIMEDLILTSKRAKQGEFHESLPAVWLRLSAVEIKRIVYLMMGKRGYINWRNFIIASLDIPFPSQAEIIAVLGQFRQLDPASLFLVDKNKFDTISLWFEPKPPCVLSEAFHALHLRECLFFMFADLNGYFYYIDFLLYFCKDQCPVIGIVKGLAVLTGYEYSINGFDTRYNDTTSVLLTDTELELIFEKSKLPEDRKHGSLVPPNTPQPKRGEDYSSGMKQTKETDEEKSQDETPSKKGKDKKRNKPKTRTKSTIRAEIKSSARARKEANLMDKNFDTSSGMNKKGNDYYFQPGPEKQLGFTLPSKQDELESQLPRESAKANMMPSESDKKFSADQTESNSIPAEAFLQAIWFGHVTSYPVEDPSFVSYEYLKMKGLVDLMYSDLFDNKLANFNDGIYTARLHRLLDHPFVKELIKRFTTYKAVNLCDILKEVLPNLSYDVDADNMESPPSTGSRDQYGKDQFLSDVDSTGEFDGTNSLLSNVMDPELRPSALNVLESNRLEIPDVQTDTSFLKSPQPSFSISAPNAISASLDARTPRSARRTRSNLPPASGSKSIKPQQ